MFTRLGRDIREMFAELRDYRELLLMMTRRDLLLRYRKTVMGFGWAIFMPVINTVVFTVIFRRVAKIETDVPYPIFSYCGLLPWNMFATSLKTGVNTLFANKSLLTKVISAGGVPLLHDARLCRRLRRRTEHPGAR